MIEVRDIRPIAEAYPALHMRLGEFHSKRHAKEQQRLAKMLEAKAKELGVSPDSTIIAKIKEKAEALIEKSKLGEDTAEMMAALRIQRVYRGMRYRRELRRQVESQMVEEGLDLDKEAEKLLRRFSSIRNEADAVMQADSDVDTHRKPQKHGNEAEHISQVARSSWKKLQQSRIEFQREFQMSRSQATTQTTLAEMAAKLDVVVRTTSQIEDNVVQKMDTRVQGYLREAREKHAAEMAEVRKALQPTSNATIVASTLDTTVNPAASLAVLQQQEGAGSGLDMAATEWLQSRGLGELAGVLGSVGTSLSDLAMLTTEDVCALQLKTLTRRRLRGHLSQLEGSKCVAPECAELDGQQLKAAIEQQLGAANT